MGSPRLTVVVRRRHPPPPPPAIMPSTNNKFVFLCCLLVSLGQTRAVHTAADKARFDEILAKFGFKGLPVTRLEEALGNDDVDDDDDVSDNLVADTETVTHLNNGVFVIKIKRKTKPLLRRKKVRRLTNLVQEDENFLKVLKMQHLNERITNPVFKSKYPARRSRNVVTRLINRK